LLFINLFFSCLQGRIISEHVIIECDEQENALQFCERECSASSEMLQEFEVILKRTLFLEAVKDGDYAQALKLLDQGADINKQSEDGQSALMIASSRGQKEFVELLLQKGAHINARDKAGKTALIEAIKAEQMDIVQMLIEQGALVA
jgi:ankyrin repeat protein